MEKKPSIDDKVNAAVILMKSFWEQDYSVGDALEIVTYIQAVIIAESRMSLEDIDRFYESANQYTKDKKKCQKKELHERQ